MKKLLAAIMSVTLLIALFTCEVSAADVAAEENTTMKSETATSDAAITEVPEEPEIIHIANGEELPDYFYVVPKEKIQAKGGFSLEGLYAYIALSLKHDYLDPKGINLEDFTFQFSELDLGIMQVDYYNAINIWDQFSYSIANTYPENEMELLEEDASYVESIIRSILVFCEATNYEEDYLNPDTLISETFELTPEKITFSDEQLYYFND